MPAALERCVAHVLSRPDFAPQEGRTDEESAYAICRTSLGLQEGDDGASMTDEEIRAAVEKRQDVSPKSGETQYGKVPFADEVNNKYPIDTEEHIRAAWNYINKGNNAAQYDASSLATIKRKIVSAWKSKIDKEGPPSAGMAEEPMNPPSLRKEMTIAFPIGDYVNGPQEGRIDPARIKAIFANTKKRGKPIPIYNLVGKTAPEHPENLDQWPADGWVEGLKIGPGGELIGDNKILGEAARMVRSDMIRGASIGTKILPLDYKGEQMGEVLHHVVLTNNPFMRGMNIAARLARGGQGVAYVFTALAKEAPVAEDKKPDTKAPAPAGGDEGVVEKYKALEIVMVEKDAIIRDLEAANRNLLEEVKAFRANPQLDLAMKELDQQKRINEANKVRFITARMAADNQIEMSALRGWYDHDSDEVVLAGFKNSQFKGKLDLLMYHRDSVPKKPGRAFVSGGTENNVSTFTAEEKEQIRKLRKDPELLEKTRGAKNYGEWKERKAAAEAAAKR